MDSNLVYLVGSILLVYRYIMKQTLFSNVIIALNFIPFE